MRAENCGKASQDRWGGLEGKVDVLEVDTDADTASVSAKLEHWSCCLGGQAQGGVLIPCLHGRGREYAHGETGRERVLPGVERRGNGEGRKCKVSKGSTRVKERLAHRAGGKAQTGGNAGVKGMRLSWGELMESGVCLETPGSSRRKGNLGGRECWQTSEQAGVTVHCLLPCSPP